MNRKIFLANALEEKPKNRRIENFVKSKMLYSLMKDFALSGTEPKTRLKLESLAFFSGFVSFINFGRPTTLFFNDKNFDLNC